MDPPKVMPTTIDVRRSLSLHGPRLSNRPVATTAVGDPAVEREASASRLVRPDGLDRIRVCVQAASAPSPPPRCDASCSRRRHDRGPASRAGASAAVRVAVVPRDAQESPRAPQDARVLCLRMHGQKDDKTKLLDEPAARVPVVLPLAMAPKAWPWPRRRRCNDARRPAVWPANHRSRSAKSRLSLNREAGLGASSLDARDDYVAVPPPPFVCRHRLLIFPSSPPHSPAGARDGWRRANRWKGPENGRLACPHPCAIVWCHRLVPGLWTGLHVLVRQQQNNNGKQQRGGG
ncbi:hypothetical protein CDD83_3841 [Cordyceps sp. RAO-2017]|nr:hypothetical protein CDD83_3841 [Cordyceps sp. RAO-2017]